MSGEVVGELTLIHFVDIDLIHDKNILHENIKQYFKNIYNIDDETEIYYHFLRNIILYLEDDINGSYTDEMYYFSELIGISIEKIYEYYNNYNKQDIINICFIFINESNDDFLKDFLKKVQ